MSDRNEGASETGRDARGRFAPGCSGGPGRPRRAVEHDYVRAAVDAVPLERWRSIVDTAAALAESGDAKAREWLARLLLGPEPIALSAIASAEARGVDPGDETVAAAVDDARIRDELLAAIRQRP